MTRFLLSLTLAAVLLTGCATRKRYGDEIAPARRYSDIQATETSQSQFAVYDPGEGLNKRVYKFNAQLDEYVLLPIVSGYKYITPEIVRKGISNFFLNIGEIPNFTNSTLQASPRKASITLARFVVNTTAGLLGTIDVATKIGLDRQQEDFGQTLGVWGVGAGPYVVIPVLGPSNLRDVSGKVFDLATLSLLIPNDVEDETAYKVIVYGLAPVNSRYMNNFRYYQSGSPFEYELVRYINNKARNLLIEK